MFFRLVEQMKKRECITEKLKSGNQMEWVQRMNNIRLCVMEIINEESLTRQKRRWTMW